MKHAYLLLSVLVLLAACSMAWAQPAAMVPTSAGFPVGIDLETYTFDPLAGDAAEASEPGKVYYVMQAHADASDDNPGTKAKPFKTITRGMAALKQFDTLYIGGGIYRESVAQHNAVMGQWEDYQKNLFTTIRNMPGEIVSIRGSDVVKDWKPMDAGKWQVSWTDFHQPQDIKDNSFSMRGTMGYGDCIFLDGKRLDIVLKAEQLKPGCFLPDRQNNRMVICLPEGQDPNQHLVEIAVRKYGLLLVGNGFKVHGLDIRHFVAEYNQGAAQVWGFFNTVENCRIEDNSYHGLLMKGSRALLRKNLCSRNGMSGIGGSMFCSVIEDNITDENCWKVPDWASGGIKIAGDGPEHIRITRHIARNNHYMGIWFDWSCKYVVIENCYLSNNTPSNIFLEASQGPFYILNNFLLGGAPGRCSGVLMNATASTSILNNLFVHNNVGIVQTNQETRHVGSDDSYVAGGYTCCKLMTVKNNIFLDNGTALAIEGGSMKFITTHTIDNNLYFGKDDTLIQAGGKLTLAQWQQKYGYDQHSQFAKPLFLASPSGADLPAPGSPIVGQGVSVAADLAPLVRKNFSDFFGRPWDPGKSDIGPIAFQPAAP